MYTGNQTSYENLSENMKKKFEELKIPIVNDLTTGGVDKAVSAEAIKELKAIVEEKANVTSLEALQTTTTEHLAEIATTEKLGHIKPDGETIIVDENGVAISVGGGAKFYQEDNITDEHSSAIGFLNYSKYSTAAAKIKSQDDTAKTISVEFAPGVVVGDTIVLRRNTGVLVESTVKGVTFTSGVVTLTLDSSIVMRPPFLKYIKVIPEASNTGRQLTSGYLNVAVGANSSAFGFNTLTVGTSSAAFGDGSQTYGSNTFAAGSDAVASGSASAAFGAFTLASGSQSFVGGQYSKASGGYSSAFGFTTEASGTGSVAIGLSTKATASAASSSGSDTVASGAYSFASGDRASATQMGSFAHGISTSSGAYYSTAFGDSTISNTYAAFSTGVFSRSMSGDTSSFDRTGTAFTIGNGSNNFNRSNAFRVTYDGAVFGLSAYNSSGADYAEYFEWEDGNVNGEERAGYVVTLDNGKIRKATSEDTYILGIVSVTPSVVGDSYHEEWRDKYVKDVWGRIQYEFRDVEYDEPVEETDDEGNINIKYVTKTRKDYLPILSSDWSEEEEYIPREERPEWEAIGLVGKLLVRDDGTLIPNNFAKVGALDGELTLSEEPTNIRVMGRVTENIVRVFIK